MKPLPILTWLLAGLALVALPACNRGAGKPKVGFVSNNTAEFWTIAETGSHKAGEDFGVEVVFRRPPNGTAAEQKEIIDTLLTMNVKAIAISVKDPKNQTSYLDRVAERAPLITQDNDAPESKRLCYIGTDNYAAGKDAGRLVKKAMPEGGKIGIFVGDMAPLNAQQRRQGVLDELAGTKDATGTMYGKYELVGTYTDDTKKDEAKAKAAAVLIKLQNEPNLCLIGLWAYNAPAILSAVKDQGKEGRVKIIGFDEDDNTLAGIEAGHIFGTIVQQPYLFGYESVKLMAALAKGDRSTVPANGLMVVPHKVIAKDQALADEFKNFQEVGAFHKKLKELLGKK